MSGNGAPFLDTADTLRRIAETGERAAVQQVREGEVETVSGDDLLRLVNGAAAALAEAGVAKGDVVALWAANSPRWIAAGLAIGHLGAVIAPLDVATDAENVAAAAQDAEATVILTDADRAGTLDDGTRVVVLDEIEGQDDAPPAAEIDPDEPVALFRTSGTTGKPKLFLLSTRNIGAGVRIVVEWGGVVEGDRVLLPLPAHHVYPWITAVLPALTIGATLVLTEGPSGPQIASALRLTRPTVIIGVPKLYDAMLDGIEGRADRAGTAARLGYRALLWLSRRLTPLLGRRIGALPMAPFSRMIAPDLRMLVSGGAHLKRELEERLLAHGWDVRTGYGLSETASAFTGTFYETRPGTAGKPIGNGEIRIEKPDEDGVGEILLRGPTVFSGYIDNPEANEGAFDEDGFFRTGDLGFIDEDGFLHVTGRAKEVIVLSGGDNLYPEDVEERYLADPRIAEIGVFERDGSLRAVVVPDPAEIGKGGTVNLRRAVSVAIDSTARDLPSTWRISGFEISREPLPRTRLGKLRRFRLPDLYDQGGSSGRETRELTQEEKEWIGEPPRDEVWKVLKRLHPDTGFDLDSSLQLDLGVDSFGWMTLSVEIEERTGASLDTVDIAGIETVRDLLEKVSEKAEGEVGPKKSEDDLLEEGRGFISRPPPPLRTVGWFCWALNRLVMRLLFRLEAQGTENIPREGPVLICPNHASDLDPSSLAAAMPAGLRPRTVWAADRNRVFGSWWQDAFARANRVFPIDELRPTVGITLAVEALERDAAQVWFAEGWRSPDGTLMEFNPGVGQIVEEARPPVVPVFIEGTLAAWPRNRRLPRLARIRVVFGEPIAADDLLEEAGDAEDRAARIARALRERVGALAKSEGADIL